MPEKGRTGDYWAEPHGGRADNLSPLEDNTVRCSIAQHRESLRGAFRLVYEMYLRDGLVRPNRLGLRILPYQLLKTSWVIVVTRGRHIVGTLSVIEDGELGLPVEPLYATEVTRLCRPGRRIAELTCFATTRAAGTQSRTVLRQLLGSAIQLAVWRKIDYFIICVHPRHARFYMHRLGFINLGPLRCCPWVLDQPAVAMCRKLGLRSDAKSSEDLMWCGPSFHQMDEEPNPASRACRAYFWPLLDEASPVPWRGRLGVAA